VTIVALPRAFADEYGVQIEAAAPGRVTLRPLRAEEGETLDDVEIAVDASYEGPLSLKELVARMPALRWTHSTGAGMDSFVSPELAERGVIVTNSSGVYAPAHVSGGSPEGGARSIELFCRNLPLYLDGETRRLGNLVELADYL
jgi:phosphoglycerate dehydrogenase-like enzyme